MDTVKKPLDLVNHVMLMSTIYLLLYMMFNASIFTTIICMLCIKLCGWLCEYQKERPQDKNFFMIPFAYYNNKNNTGLTIFEILKANFFNLHKYLLNFTIYNYIATIIKNIIHEIMNFIAIVLLVLTEELFQLVSTVTNDVISSVMPQQSPLMSLASMFMLPPNPRQQISTNIQMKKNLHNLSLNPLNPLLMDSDNESESDKNSEKDRNEILTLAMNEIVNTQ